MPFTPRSMNLQIVAAEGSGTRAMAVMPWRSAVTRGIFEIAIVKSAVLAIEVGVIDTDDRQKLDDAGMRKGQMQAADFSLFRNGLLDAVGRGQDNCPSCKVAGFSAGSLAASAEQNLLRASIPGSSRPRLFSP